MANARVSVLIDLRSRLQGLEKAQIGFKSLIRTAAGFAATYASIRSVVNGSKDIIQLGAHLDHLKSRTGESASDILTFRQALEDAGVSAQKGDQALDRLTRRVRLSIGQNNSYAKSLKELGLDPEKINQLSKLERFQTVAEALRNTSDESLKTHAAMELLDTSAGELFALIDNPHAFDDAARSIGNLGSIMDRNSVSFERADTLLGRMKNKSRQLFAGIGDILIDDLLKPLESINQMDFSGFGQRLGAYIQVGLNAFKNDRFAEFIGLTIEAGFEQGLSAAKSIWKNLFSSGSDDIWNSALNTAMTFGVEVARVLLDAFEAPISYLSTGFRWVASQITHGFSVTAKSTSSVFEDVINFISGGFENLLNHIIDRVNKITKNLPFTDGSNIENVQIAKVSWGKENTEEAGRFSDILKEQQEGVKSISDFIQETLNSNLIESREILGLGTEETSNQASATAKLNELIKEQIELRDKDITKAQSNTSKSPNFDSNFTDTDSYDPETVQNPKSALQEYVVQAGTVAQQVHKQIGSIAGSIQNSIGQSISGLINRTMTWGDALRNIGGSVVQSVIQSFSDMAASWVTKQLMMFALGQKLKVADSANTAAKGVADTAAMAPAAATASIASFGVAAAIGLAAVIAAMAVFGGFAEGGFTGEGSKHTPAGIVHAGEDVFSQANIALWGGGSEGLRNVELLRQKGPSALPLVANRVGYDSTQQIGNYRFPSSMPGYANGGIVGNHSNFSDWDKLSENAANTQHHLSQDKAFNESVNVAIVDSDKAAKRYVSSRRGRSSILSAERQRRTSRRV